MCALAARTLLFKQVVTGSNTAQYFTGFVDADSFLSTAVCLQFWHYFDFLITKFNCLPANVGFWSTAIVSPNESMIF